MEKIGEKGLSESETNSTPSSCGYDEILDQPYQHLTKDDIIRIISHESNRITYSNKENKSTSSVWVQFELMFLDKKKVNFVRCVKCKKVLSYKYISGTSTLSRHSEKCSAAPGRSQKVSSSQSISQPKITGFVAKKVPDEVIKKLNQDIVIGLAQEITSTACC